jgi:hypothetical protein
VGPLQQSGEERRRHLRESALMSIGMRDPIEEEGERERGREEMTDR